MQLKTIFSIAAFCAALTLSVVLFGSESTEIELNNQPAVYALRSDYSSVDSDLQMEMRLFLEEDKRHGLVFYGEVAGAEDDLAAQVQPTARLVKKMQAMNCSNLPNDFCADWKLHVKAWKNLSNVLNQAAHRNFDTVEVSDKYNDANDQINDSYENLLTTAEGYDVDFR